MAIVPYSQLLEEELLGSILNEVGWDKKMMKSHVKGGLVWGREIKKKGEVLVSRKEVISLLEYRNLISRGRQIELNNLIDPNS